MFKDVKAAVEKALDDMNSVLDQIEDVEHLLDEEEREGDPCFVELYQDIHERLLKSHVEVAGSLVTEINRNRARRRILLDEMARETQELGLYERDEDEINGPE